MAKLKKRILRWQASSSPQVIGYKLYWSDDGDLSYDSNQETVGNVTEIVLPDDVESFKPSSGPIELGIVSVDELGNESDMIKLMAPYQFSVPEAPQNLRIEKLEQINPTHTTAYSESDAEEEEAFELLEAIALEQKPETFPRNKKKGNNGGGQRIFD
jgi:hypothetical protein